MLCCCCCKQPVPKTRKFCKHAAQFRVLVTYQTLSVELLFSSTSYGADVCSQCERKKKRRSFSILTAKIRHDSSPRPASTKREGMRRSVRNLSPLSCKPRAPTRAHIVIFLILLCTCSFSMFCDGFAPRFRSFGNFVNIEVELFHVKVSCSFWKISVSVSMDHKAITNIFVVGTWIFVQVHSTFLSTVELFVAVRSE